MPGTVRQAEIEQREIESGIVGCRRKRAFKIAYADHVGCPLEREEREAKRIRHHGVIVDDEDFHSTVPVSLPVRRF